MKTSPAAPTQHQPRARPVALMCPAAASLFACKSDVGTGIEICDGQDNDCDGIIDNGDDAPLSANTTVDFRP